MAQNEESAERIFFQRFNSLGTKIYISGKLYLIKLEYPRLYGFGFDYFIKVGSRVIGILEIKYRRNLETFSFVQIEDYALKNDIRFVVVYDGEDLFVVIDRSLGNKKTTTNFDGFINILQTKQNINTNDLEIKIANRIISIINESQFNSLKKGVFAVENLLKESIVYDEISHTFSFSNSQDIDNVENRIFRLLLDESKSLKKIYRYTTLSTIFSILKYNSFRMNCLIGMNDTSEVNYTENYVLGNSRSFTQASEDVIEAYNRRFISSSSLKKDDLTQWRLYADDSKGICLVFTLRDVNSKFLLKRISYGKQDGTHLKLDFIKYVISTIKSDFGVRFEFKTLSTWRHFFKPYEYEGEREVRLLYISDDKSLTRKDWLLTTSHNILNPYVEFSLDEKTLPIQLSEVVFGPKCPEKEINIRQFEQFFNEQKTNGKLKLSKLKFSVSKINNYR